MKLTFTLFLLSIIPVLNAQNVQRNSPVEIITKAMIALGTDKKIKEIENIKISGYGYRNLLEQSERYEGPYITSQISFNIAFDFKHTVGQLDLREMIYTFHSNSSYVIDDDKIAIKTPGGILPCPQERLIIDDLHLNPLQLFQKALISPDLRSLPDTSIQNVEHYRIQFLWKTYPVIISLNGNTYLPTIVETRKPYSDNYLEIWGDIRKVVHYSFWDLFEKGVHYPRQMDVYINGNLYESTMITEMKFNQRLLPDSLRIPPNIKMEIANLNQMNRMNIQKMMDLKEEIAPNIWLLPGFCNSTIIEQNNEITIIESPNTSSNTEMIFDQAVLLYPKCTIKQVITTSDAWLHLGGVRAAVNRASVFALKENKKIIDDLLNANYETVPDAWQMRADRKAVIKYIDQRTRIGNGAHRFELIPFWTEAGERMMMVYFPEYRLLYASDLLQPDNWQKHYSLEVIEAINREKLTVENIYAMHMKPIPYSELLKQMESYLPK